MPVAPNQAPLILASASKYRRELLARLSVDFSSVAPGTIETRQAGEAPDHLAMRLAREKAQTIAAQHSKSVVIGADQVATRGDTVLGKPGDHEAAHRQLLESSDQGVSFYTAVYLLDPLRGSSEHHLDHTRVHFRSLRDDEIQRYLELEKPYDCAGAFKAEGLGISLFWRINTDDPTALQGLPLIWLASALRRAGFVIP
ncbi:MAG: Maf family nucleotide pyrophosphatase [Gammaproteobacteria bacterium]|nr:Maf family nucleotide pyrophosphatase [Gammaproteobacteria bacterium]MDH3767053.1 Maf family nucleotide pyrophosphatase [Gammaproteobacteria bacterium]